MYVSVVAILLGQALFFGSLGIAIYTACVWLFVHLFVVFYEEPTLRSSFEVEYKTFCEQVPRWIPRLTAWRGSEG